jgi:putative nucleotidyltransferase with HDIG domain
MELLNFLKDAAIDRFSLILRSYRTLLIVLIVSILTAVICRNPFREKWPTYSMGDIARKDIKASEKLRIVDEELTEKRRAAVADVVLPVYDYDPEAKQLTYRRLMRGLELLEQASPQKIEKTKTAVEESLGLSFSTKEWKLLLDQKNREPIRKLVQRALKEFSTLWLLDEMTLPTKSEILIRDVRSGEEFKLSQKAYLKKMIVLSEAREMIRNPTRFPRAEASLFTGSQYKEALAIVAGLLEADLAFNEIETKTRQDEMKGKIEPVWAEIAKDEVIVREGQRIEHRDLLLIQRLNELGRNQSDFQSTFFFSALMLFLIFAFYFLGKANFKKFRFSFRDQWVLGSFFVVSLSLIAGLQHLFAAARSQTLIGPSLDFLMPVAFAGMTVRLFSSMEITTFFIVLFGIAIGWMTENAYYGIIVLTAALTGAGAMRHITQRLDVFRAGFLAGVTKALLLGFGFGLKMVDSPGFESEVLNILTLVFFGIASGIISSGIILGIQPILEYVGYTTDLRLMELSNTNHPLLKDLIMKAPGTYFHSFTVSQLAEKAAEAIHANSLFVRVASLYHDIGKVKKPQYFIENVKGDNKHDKLVPSMSALIIANHVKDGIELGYEHHLPQSIIDVIPQHHGTSLISFFYDKAKKQSDRPGDIQDRDFRYPGPKPQTRESAIVLLADAVEATAKSIQEKSPDILTQMVHQTIQRFFIDGQLDECDLTLKDLNAIGNAFLQVLQGVYHQRIDYPHLKESFSETESSPSKGKPAPA